MKRMKKLVGFLLTMMLVLGMVTTALAEGTTGTITVNNTVKDEDYSIYRIFDLESFSGDAYSYKVNSAWSAFFEKGAKGLDYVTIDENGYVTWKDDEKAADFAKDAIEFATAEATKIVAVDTKQASADNSPVVFDELPLGYYLVDSSLGALCALTTTNPTAEVIEKNAKPSLEKWVKEGETWQKNNDANIGDEVEFKAEITVQGYANSYVMHDQMDDGLTFGEVTKVTLNENVVATDKYTVKTENSDDSDECTFEVEFTKEFCDTLKSGDVIVVYYNATLNDNAVVKEPENNNAHLSYKDTYDTTRETEDSNTKTYTWEMPVLKYANGNKDTPLAGAKFSLYTDENCTAENVMKFREVKENEKTTVYRVDKEGTVTEITTDETGKFKLEGLDAGTYYLKETEAPAGYNKLDTVVKVVISSEGNSTDNTLKSKLELVTKTDSGETKTDITEVQVENKSGTILPSTGGMGTTVFYVIGAILVVAAVVLLVTKKRMNND